MAKAIEEWGTKSDGAHGLTKREKYACENAPKLTSALLRRPNGFQPNELVAQAIQAAEAIYDRAVDGKLTDRGSYLLRHCPEILSAILLRRPNTLAKDLVEPALSTTGRIYDVMHDMTVAAEAMISQPVDLRR